MGMGVGLPQGGPKRHVTNLSSNCNDFVTGIQDTEFRWKLNELTLRNTVMKAIANDTFTRPSNPSSWLSRSNPGDGQHRGLGVHLRRMAASQPHESRGIIVSWAEHQDEVRAAQRLRFEVFATEMGATLRTPIPGHDIDLFDDFCEHLLARDVVTQQVIGTYRVLTPVQAKRVGSTYSDTEFDLTRLRSLRSRMVELGRSCVHADHRHGGVILALWSALTAFMLRNDMDTMIGCASVPLLQHGAVGTRAAASIWHQLQHTHLAPIEVRVTPRLALPVDQLNTPEHAVHAEPPALVKAYLRLGAKVLGPPAWDPEFNSADLPLLLRVTDIPARYSKHFKHQG